MDLGFEREDQHLDDLGEAFCYGIRHVLDLKWVSESGREKSCDCRKRSFDTGAVRKTGEGEGGVTLRAKVGGRRVAIVREARQPGLFRKGSQ